MKVLAKVWFIFGLSAVVLSAATLHGCEPGYALIGKAYEWKDPPANAVSRVFVYKISENADATIKTLKMII
jgi:hypothetical protein